MKKLSYHTKTLICGFLWIVFIEFWTTAFHHLFDFDKNAVNAFLYSLAFIMLWFTYRSDRASMPMQYECGVPGCGFSMGAIADGKLPNKYVDDRMRMILHDHVTKYHPYNESKCDG